MREGGLISQSSAEQNPFTKRFLFADESELPSARLNYSNPTGWKIEIAVF